MPQTELKLFRTSDGRVPILEWLEQLPTKAQDKCLARIIRLKQLGHRVRRPEADLLRDRIWELRAKLARNQYRMLYFFHGREAIILTHGFLKNERRVPRQQIEFAIRCRNEYLGHPVRHTASMEV